MLLLKNLEDFAEENLDNALEDLFKLTRIPTVTAKGGEFSSEAIAVLTKIFNELDFKCFVNETKGEPVFTSVLDVNKPKTLLFYDHYDVQPAEPFDQWTSPPIDPEIRDEKIYGRGVADNKGNIIARVYAVKMIQELRGELPVNVKFVIEGEEEVSSPNLKEYVDTHHDFLFSDQTSCIWEFGGTNTLGFDISPWNRFDSMSVRSILLNSKPRNGQSKVTGLSHISSRTRCAAVPKARVSSQILWRRL